MAMRHGIRGLLCAALTGLACTLVPGPSWALALDVSNITQALGRTGQMMPGDVYRVAFPRTDLHVTVDGIPIRPGLALGSYAVFKQYGNDAMMMGDLVLLQSEVEPVMAALADNGIQITALHNHLLKADPQVMYLHYMGTGHAGRLAMALRNALRRSKTPLAASPRVSATAVPWFRQAVEQVLGRIGTVSGGVLAFSVPRAGDEQAEGMVIPASMGTGEVLNFQDAGNHRVATTGDFSLTADEVNPVLRTLRGHSIDVTALHSHMLDDTPRLFFVHFWAVGDPTKVAAGLRAAIDKVKIR